MEKILCIGLLFSGLISRNPNGETVPRYTSQGNPNYIPIYPGHPSPYEGFSAVAPSGFRGNQLIYTPDWIRIFNSNGGVGVDWSSIFEQVRGSSPNWSILLKSIQHVNLNPHGILHEAHINGPDFRSISSQTGGKEVVQAILIQVAAFGGASAGTISMERNVDPQRRKYVWNVKVGNHPAVNIDGGPIQVGLLPVEPPKKVESVAPSDWFAPFDGNPEANRIWSRILHVSVEKHSNCSEILNQVHRMNVNWEEFMRKHIATRFPWGQLVKTPEGKKIALAIIYQQASGHYDWIKFLTNVKGPIDFIGKLQQAAGDHVNVHEAIYAPDWITIFEHNGGAGVDWSAIFEKARNPKVDWHSLLDSLKYVNLNPGAILREGRIQAPDLGAFGSKVGGKEAVLAVLLQVAAGGGANPGTISITQYPDVHKNKYIWNIKVGNHPTFKIDGEPIQVGIPPVESPKKVQVVRPSNWFAPFDGNPEANRIWSRIFAVSVASHSNCSEIVNEVHRMDVNWEDFMKKHIAPNIPWEQIVKTPEGKKIALAVVYQQASGHYDWIRYLHDTKGPIDFIGKLQEVVGDHANVQEIISAPDWIQIFNSNGGAGVDWSALFEKVRGPNVNWAGLLKSIKYVDLNPSAILREGKIQAPELGGFESQTGGKEAVLAILLQVAAGGGAHPGTISITQYPDLQRNRYVWNVKVGNHPTVKIDGDQIQAGLQPPVEPKAVRPSNWFAPFDRNPEANRIWSRILHVSVEKHSNCSEILNEVHRMHVNWEDFMKKHITPNIPWEQIVKTPEGKKTALAIVYQQASGHYDWVKYLHDTKGPIDFIGKLQQVAGDHVNVHEAIHAPDWIHIFKHYGGAGVDWSPIFEQVRDPNVNWPRLFALLKNVNLNPNNILREGHIQGPDLAAFGSQIGGKEAVLVILLQVAAGGGAHPGTISITQYPDLKKNKYIWNVKVGNHPTVKIDGEPLQGGPGHIVPSVEEGAVAPTDWLVPFDGNPGANLIWTRIREASALPHTHCSEMLNEVHGMNVNWEEFMTKHIAPGFPWGQIVKTPEGKKIALYIAFLQATGRYDWVKFFKDVRGQIDLIGKLQEVVGDHVNVQEAISAPDWIRIFESNNSGARVNWRGVFERVRDPKVHWRSILNALKRVNLNPSGIQSEAKVQGLDLGAFGSQVGGKEVVLVILLQVAAFGGANPGAISISKNPDLQRMKYVWSVKVGDHPAVSIDGEDMDKPTYAPVNPPYGGRAPTKPRGPKFTYGNHGGSPFIYEVPGIYTVAGKPEIFYNEHPGPGFRPVAVDPHVQIQPLSQPISFTLSPEVPAEGVKVYPPYN